MRAWAVETHLKSLRNRNTCQDFTMTRATLYGNLRVKCCRPKPRRRLCASLRARNACQHFTKATLCRNLQVKMPQTKMSLKRRERRKTLCASLRSRNACQDFTGATRRGNVEVKCRRPKRTQHFVRACAVETHVNISQESLYKEIYR